MATSGSSDWSQTRDEIIQQILEELNMIGIGATPSATLVSMVSTKLNQYIKYLQKVHSIKLWKLEPIEYTFSAASEVTGTDSKVYTCISDHTSSSDDKPITGAEFTSKWAQRGSTGGTWVTSTAYTSTGKFTDSTNDLIGVESAFIRQGSVDTPVKIIGYDEYMEISNKTDEGTPSRLYFDNKISPTMYIHPHLEDTDDVLHILGIVRIEDFDAAIDDPDFPVEWIQAIMLNTAVMLINKADLTPDERRALTKNARDTLSETLSGSAEKITEIQFKVG